MFVIVSREMFDMTGTLSWNPHSSKEHDMENAGIGYPNF
jgi:hypothetical protein